MEYGLPKETEQENREGKPCEGYEFPQPQRAQARPTLLWGLLIVQ